MFKHTGCGSRRSAEVGVSVKGLIDHKGFGFHLTTVVTSQSCPWGLGSSHRQTPWQPTGELDAVSPKQDTSHQTQSPSVKEFRCGLWDVIYPISLGADSRFSL